MNSKTDFSFRIYCPSYGRAETTTTNKLFDEITYVVRKSEEEKYRRNGINDLIAVEDKLIDSGIKVHEWIINNAKEDVICILDDDIEKFIYRMDISYDIVDNETIYDELYRIGQIMVDLDIGYGATDNTSIPYNYTQEIAWKGIPGSTKIINRNVFKAKIDDSVKYNFDIDEVLQELLANRVCFFPKYMVSKAKIDSNSGGGSGKKRADQIDSIHNMKYKWGRYFDYDFKKNKPKINVKR